MFFAEVSISFGHSQIAVTEQVGKNVQVIPFHREMAGERMAQIVEAAVCDVSRLTGSSECNRYLVRGHSIKHRRISLASYHQWSQHSARNSIQINHAWLIVLTIG